MAYSPPVHDDSGSCQMFCHACAAVSLVPTHVFARDAQEEPACPACASTFVEKQNIQQPTNSTRTNDAPGETSGRESTELSPFPPNFEMFLSGNATHNDEQAQQMYVFQTTLEDIGTAAAAAEAMFAGASNGGGGAAGGFSLADYGLGRSLEDIMAELSVTAGGGGSAARPATEDAISNLPPCKRRDGDSGGDNGEHRCCAICHDALFDDEQQDEQGTALLPCGHAYHRHCVTQWLLRSGTCPVCRVALV